MLKITLATWGKDALVAGGIAVVPRLHSVKDPHVRIAIYDEVHTYFQSNTNAFTS